MSSLATTARALVAVAFVAFGVQHLLYGAFVTRVVPGWPAGMPGTALLARASGVVLVAAGLAILARRRVPEVATALGCALLVSFLASGVPFAAADSRLGGRWTSAGKALALAGGSLLVAQSAAATGTAPAAVARLWALGPWCVALFLVLCGIQHYVHAAFVQTLVPLWIPGALFWTYFTGAALVAAGIGLVVPQTAPLAGLLTGAMIGTWVVVLHVPRALADLSNANETTAVFEALAMSGIALLVAVTSRVRRSS